MIFRYISKIFTYIKGEKTIQKIQIWKISHKIIQNLKNNNSKNLVLFDDPTSIKES